MGSYNEFIVGRGKNKQEAFNAAWDDYVHENGHRCSFRGTENSTLKRRVPPVKPHVEVKHGMSIHSSRPDTSAPASEWLEEWEFEVWVHS